jgi:O-antigen/teichoic acid export membrane protein
VPGRIVWKNHFFGHQTLMIDETTQRVEDRKRFNSHQSRFSPITLASFIGMATQAVSLVLGLWSTPRIVHGLGDSAYGALAVISTFAAYFAYLELGIGGAYLRDLAIALSRRDLDRAQALYETAHAIYVRIGFAGAGGILLVGLPYLSNTMSDPSLLPRVQLALLVLSVNFLMSMCLSASRAVVLSAQRPDLYNFASLLVQPAIPIAQVIAISRGYGIVLLLVIQGVGSLGVDAAMYWLTKRLVPTLVLRRRFNPRIWAELRSFSVYKFLSQLGMQGQVSGDRLLLATLVPMSSIAPYAVAASIAQRIRIVAAAISGPFYTAASDQYGRHGIDGLFTITRKFCRPICVLLAVGTAAAIFLSRLFLSAWIGEQYAVQGTSVLRLIVVSTSLLVVANLLGWSADASGAPRVNAWAAMIGLGISVLVGAVLVMRMGPVGAAWGFLAGAAIQLLVVGYGLASIFGRRKMLELTSLLALRPIVVSGSAYGAMIWVPRGASFVSAIPAAICGVVIGVIVAWFLRLVPGARAQR